MTASEQQAEYAATTPTIGKKLRAAIEADVLRRVVEQLNNFPSYAPLRCDDDRIYAEGRHDELKYVVDHLRAEADRIERTARPTPEGGPR